MNSYWSVIPTRVRKSKILSAEEKELYYEIKERCNPAGYCTDSNAELAKALNVSEKTITARLAGLIAKKFANTTLNTHKHKRLIYLHVPGAVQEPEKPTGEEIQENVKNFQESLKKAIIFGNIDPKLLVQRFKESPYLENLEDNSTQFVMTIDQIKFLAKFIRYPGKKIDCQIANYPNVDYMKLINHLESSQFLQENANLSLKWCLSHYADIIEGVYKTSIPSWETMEKRKSPYERTYSPESLNSLFMSIDEMMGEDA